MKPQSTLDKWFMRSKDVFLLIGGFGGLGACFVFAFNYYSLPFEVKAQAADIKTAQASILELHDYTLRNDGRLSRIEDRQSYTNKGIDDIKVLITKKGI